jgi:ankyrin repeat protein
MLASNTCEPLVLLQSTLDELTPGADSRNYFPEYRYRLPEWDFELGLSNPDPVVRLLEDFMYLSSNKQLEMLRSRKEYNFFDWIVDNVSNPMLDALLHAKLPTTEACIEHILAQSLSRGNLGLTRTLLAKDNTVLRTKALSANTDENRIENDHDQDHSFNALFEVAVHRDDTEIILHFLEATEDAGRISPLWNAQSPEVVELLLSYGASVNKLHKVRFSILIEPYSMTAVFWATYYGNTAVVQSLIKNGGDVNLAALDNSNSELGTPNCLGVTPLFAAIGRAVNELTRWGETKDGQDDSLQLIRVLLNAGADVNGPSNGIYKRLINSTRTLTPLQFASKAGHKTLSALLLDSGANINTPAFQHGSTALLGAVESGHADLAEMLLKRGANIDASGRDESRPPVTSLMVAVQQDDAAMVTLLMEAGANSNLPVVGRLGSSVIEIAELSLKGPEILQILMKFGALQTYEGQRRSQFIDAISKGDLSLICSMLDAGLNFSIPHGFRSQVLRRAIESGAETILSLLIQVGIDVNKLLILGEDLVPCHHKLSRKDKRFLGFEHITPLGYAIISRKLSRNTRLAIVSMMLDTNADPNRSIWSEKAPFLPPLHLATDLWLQRRLKKCDGLDEYSEYDEFGEGFEPQLIRLLVERGASVNLMGSRYRHSMFNSARNQWTVLSLLAGDPLWSKSCESLNLAEMILKASKNVSAAGLGALVVAANCGNLELAEFLLDHKVDINSQDLSHGMTALQAAIFNKSFHSSIKSMAMIDLLLKKGANINAPPSKHLRLTALQAAVFGLDLDLSRRLISLGADVNAPGLNNAGYDTAIHIAARLGGLQVAHLLLENGADVNPAFIDPETDFSALEGAAEEGRLDMVQLLINVGADTHLPGSMRYRSAEGLAREKGHIAVADILKDRFEDQTWG